MEKISIHPLKHSNITRIAFSKSFIDTSPEYQRQGDIWTLEKKQLLIDSIINDFDMPKIYFHELSKSKILENGKEVTFSIIDGRQRLETIWSFMNDEFPLSKDFVYYENPKIDVAGMTYSQMSQKHVIIKVNFDSFELPIICVKTDEIDLIEEMFSRLNEAVPLNAAEKRNAIGGPMAEKIRDLSKHPFFEKVRFNNRRYQYQEVITRLMFIEESLIEGRIIDTKKPYLDNFVKKYKENSDVDSKNITKTVKRILNEMANIFQDKDELLRSQANVPIYYMLFKLAIKQGNLNLITRPKILKFKESVDKNRLIAEDDISKSDFSLLEFHRLTIQGTNDASSIKERTNIISKFFNLENTLFT